MHIKSINLSISITVPEALGAGTPVQATVMLASSDSYTQQEEQVRLTYIIDAFLGQAA